MVRACLIFLVIAAACLVFEFSVLSILKSGSLLFKALPSLVSFAGLVAAVFFALKKDEWLPRLLGNVVGYLSERRGLLMLVTGCASVAAVGLGVFVWNASKEKDGIFVVQVVEKNDVPGEAIPDVPVELDHKLKNETLSVLTGSDGKASFAVNIGDTFAVRIRRSRDLNADVAVLGDSKLKIDDKTKANFLLVKRTELEGAWIKRENVVDAQGEGLAFAEIPSSFFRWRAHGDPSEIDVDSDPLVPPFALPQAESIIRRKAYIVGFSPLLRLPRWVAYRIVPGSPIQRSPDRFFSDPALPSSYQAAADDYARNDYDRGTLVTRADLFGLGPEETAKIFNLSATVPQLAFVNQRSWLRLEQYTSKKAAEGGNIHVIRGPIFGATDGERSGITLMGPNGIFVPTHFFQILVDTRDPRWRVEAHILPNAYVETLGTDTNQDVFKVDVKRVQELTGLSFDTRLLQ
jgi:DNA/RNA endonuclease G (NUC1)